MTDFEGALSRGTSRARASSRGADGRATSSEAFPGVLLAAQSGASWACTNLWIDYAPAVMGFLRARGSHEPEDLTSEVFLAVFDTLDRFRGNEAEFRAFVFTIAYRRLVDELRRRSARGIHVEWDDDTDPRRSASAEHEAIGNLADASARAMLDGLPPDQRDVMVLRIIGDLTIEQVAEIVGKRSGRGEGAAAARPRFPSKEIPRRAYPCGCVRR